MSSYSSRHLYLLNYIKENNFKFNTYLKLVYL
jgi:hypothetical protein